jgi:hypothetical protein
MSYGDKPFGLHELVVKVGEETVALPHALTMTFKERVMSKEFPGDDKLKGVHTISEGAELSLENGGIPLEAYALITGREVTTEGVSPDEVSTMVAAGATPYPYFELFGKVLGEGNDDVHVHFFKAKLTEAMEGEFKYGEFFVTKMKALAVDDGVNGVYEFIQNETAAELDTEGS